MKFTPLPSRLGRLPAAVGSGFAPVSYSVPPFWTRNDFYPSHQFQNISVPQQSTVLTVNLLEQETDVKAKLPRRGSEIGLTRKQKHFCLSAPIDTKI